MFPRSTGRQYRVMVNRGPLNHRVLTRIRTRVRQNVVKMQRSAVHFVGLRAQRTRVRRRNVRSFRTLVNGRLVGLVGNHVGQHRSIKGPLLGRALDHRNRHLAVAIGASGADLQHHFRRDNKVANGARHTIRNRNAFILWYQHRGVRAIVGRR